MIKRILRRIFNRNTETPKGEISKKEREESLEFLLSTLPKEHRNSAILGVVNNGSSNRREHIREAFEHYNKDDNKRKIGIDKLAELAERIGDIETAVELYIREKMPIDAAEVYERHGSIDQAISLLRRDELQMMFSKFVDSGRRYMKLADLFEKKGDHEEARKQRYIAVSCFIKTGHSNEVREILSRYSDHEGLANAYERLAESTKSTSFLLDAARVHMELGNIARMQALYFEYIVLSVNSALKSKLPPEFTTLTLSIERDNLFKCVTNVNEDNREEVVDLFEEVGYYGLAATIAEEYGMLERAVDLLVKLNDEKDWLYAAQLCEELKDYSRASEFYEKADYLVKAAISAQRAGDNDRVIKICNKGLKRESEVDNYTELVSMAITVCREMGDNALLEYYTSKALSFLAEKGAFGKCAEVCMVAGDQNNAVVYRELAELRTKKGYFLEKIKE